jgi:hypothetical protein
MFSGNVSDARGVSEGHSATISLSIATALLIVEMCDRSSKRQRIAIDEDDEIQTTFDDLPIDLLRKHVLPFVGGKAFRFVAAVNRKFRAAYTSLYPGKKTRCIADTLEHVKIFLNEAKTLPSPSTSERFYASAAEKGSLDIIRFLRRKKFPWHKRTCSSAARGGHLDVLQWLRKNHCPWDENTCRSAAANGHFNVLKWARVTVVPGMKRPVLRPLPMAIWMS